MAETLTMIELFGGIGAQERSLRQLGIPYEVTHYCDCDKDATLSYAAMRYDFEKELAEHDFPSQDQMIEELQFKNVGFDFEKGKHTITKKTPLIKLQQYYLADKLTHNLGDISKVEKLPYADLVTYSYPCTDLSVAGRGEGMVNKCDKCNHTWAIDFETPKNNNICPQCGNIDIKSTRSGLLGQVQRLLTISHKENTLPKYLLLENVKNLVGKKFKPQFDAWVNWLDLIGYNTYYKVLNAKHYGIPQNRERIFAISIRKDIDEGTFQFPEQITLTTRLKDILETNVDEKYYLPDERIEKILNSSFMQEKKRIQMTDVCDTLLARDWKDPKCVPVEEDVSPIRIGNIYDEKFGTGYAGNVWDKEGISPTLQTAQGGNRQPLIIDEIKVVGNDTSSDHHETMTAITEPQVARCVGGIGEKKSNGGAQYYQQDRVYMGEVALAHPANLPGGSYHYVVEEPFVVASRGRNPENPSDRTTGAPTEQRLEPNFSGCTNTLTSVQKDNYICEPQVLRAERTEYGKAIRKQYEAGEVEEKIGNMREMKPRTDGVANTVTTLLKDNYVAEPIIYDDYNSRISADQDSINTLTTSCGASAERNGVKIIEPRIVEDQFPGSRDARIYDKYSPTLRQNCGGLKVANSEDESVVLEEKIRWRIRKLTSRECWRLMGFTDEDHNRAAKYVSASALYKQAGNSICTCCLISIFYSLFFGDSSTNYAQYLIHFDA